MAGGVVADDTMDMLFDGGKGQLVQTVTSWLSSDHVNLQAAGALAIANFARKGMCRHIVQICRADTMNNECVVPCSSVTPAGATSWFRGHNLLCSW